MEGPCGGRGGLRSAGTFGQGACRWVESHVRSRDWLPFWRRQVAWTRKPSTGRRKLRLSPARRSALRLQGQYMGHLKALEAQAEGAGEGFARRERGSPIHRIRAEAGQPIGKMLRAAK